MTKIALGIEYNGAQFYGWQRQQEVDSIQAALESALSKVADEEILIQCAGRTDAGVHATGQVIHFKTDKIRDVRAWTRGVNTHLSADIGVNWAREVEDEFHARFSATARRYRYIILNSPIRSTILNEGITHFYQPLDVQSMYRSSRCLLGENDFTSFRATRCQSHSPYRTVSRLDIHRIGHYVVIDIEANAFVHHMVRNITGAICQVGCGAQNEGWIEELLALKDRRQSAATAKPNGLYLVNVTYPEKFNLPRQKLGPLFLPDDLISMNHCE